MATWCNDCTSNCTLDGCYDACGLNEVAHFFVFLVLVVGVGVVGGLGATGTVFVAKQLNGDNGYSVGEMFEFRWPILVAAAPGGISQLVTHFFSLFTRETTYFSSAANSTGMALPPPPCIRSSFGIGLWGLRNIDADTTSFLESCSSTQAPFEAMQVLATAALACAVLLVAGSLSLTWRWPLVVLWLATMGLLVGTAIAGETTLGMSDFCGSGRTLTELEFERGSSLNAVYAALVFFGGGGIVTVVIHILVDPTPKRDGAATDAEEAQAVVGVPVEAERAPFAK